VGETGAMTERATITISEAAQVLGIGRTAAYEAARRGELPVLRLGRRLLVPRARLEDLLGGNAERTDGDRSP
jgi:excisionase family DNA binding protein